MSEAEKQKKRDEAAERQRKKRAKDKAEAEKLGMAPTHIDLAEGERRRWATQARARGRDPEEYLVWLMLQDEEALVMMGIDLSQFEVSQKRDSHADTKEVA